MRDVKMTDQEYLNLWVDLVHAKDAISKLRQKELKRYKISPEQSAILSFLQDSGVNPTPADLSRQLFKDPSTVTIILNKMAAKDLVKKETDENKKNLIRVSLTENGRRIHNQIVQTMCIYRIMAELSEAQCKQLKKCLDILLAKTQTELNS